MTLLLTQKGEKFTAIGENKDFNCCNCGKLIREEGFVCENNLNIVLCQKCQDSFNMINCKHDKRGEHRHIKFMRAK